MPKICFVADPKLPRDMLHLGYRKGTEVHLPADKCERWIRRNVAVLVRDEPAVEVAAEYVEPMPFVPWVPAKTFVTPTDGLVAPEPAEPVTEAEFDVNAADADALRTFLTSANVVFHHRAGEAKLRELAEAYIASKTAATD